MDLFQHHHLTAPSKSVHSGSASGCWGTGMWVSLPASASLSSPSRDKKEIIPLPHGSLHFSALTLWIYGFSYSRCVYLHVQTSPRLWGTAPASLMEVVLPRNSFWVLMSLKSRGQILGSSVPLLCSILALQRGSRTGPKSQLNLFSGTEGRIIRTRLFPLEKWASFCSRDEWAAMKFYNSHNKPIIKVVTEKKTNPKNKTKKPPNQQKTVKALNFQ